MSGWIVVLTLIAVGLALAVLIAYAAERSLRRGRERFRKSLTWRDGGCLVCDECDGDEGHGGPHDCGHLA